MAFIPSSPNLSAATPLVHHAAQPIKAEESSTSTASSASSLVFGKPDAKQKQLQDAYRQAQFHEQIQQILSHMKSDFPLDPTAFHGTGPYDPNAGLVKDGVFQHSELFLALQTTETSHLRQKPKNNKANFNKAAASAETIKTIKDVSEEMDVINKEWNAALKEDKQIREKKRNEIKAVQALDGKAFPSEKIMKIEKELQKKLDLGLDAASKKLVLLFNRLESIPSTENSRDCFKKLHDQIKALFIKRAEIVEERVDGNDTSITRRVYSNRRVLDAQRKKLELGGDLGTYSSEERAKLGVNSKKEILTMLNIFQQYKWEEAKDLPVIYEHMLFKFENFPEGVDEKEIAKTIMNCFKPLYYYEITCATLINKEAVDKKIFRANLDIPSEEEKQERIIAAQERRLKVGDSGNVSSLQTAAVSLQELADIREERYTFFQLSLEEHLFIPLPDKPSRVYKMNQEKKQLFLNHKEGLEEVEQAYQDLKIDFLHHQAMAVNAKSEEEKSGFSENVERTLGEINHHLFFVQARIKLVEIMLEKFRASVPEAGPSLQPEQVKEAEPAAPAAPLQTAAESISELLDQADKEISESEASDHEDEPVKKVLKEKLEKPETPASPGRAEEIAPPSSKGVSIKDMQGADRKKFFALEETDSQRKTLRENLKPLFDCARKEAANAAKLARFYQTAPTDINAPEQLKQIVRTFAKAASYYRKARKELEQSPDVKGKVLDFKDVEELLAECDEGVKEHGGDAQLHRTFSRGDKSRQPKFAVLSRLDKAGQLQPALAPDYDVKFPRKKDRIIAIFTTPTPVVVDGVEKSLPVLPRVIHVHIPYDMKVSIEILENFDAKHVKFASAKNMRQHTSGIEYAKRMEQEKKVPVFIEHNPLPDHEWVAQHIRRAAKASRLAMSS